MVGTRLGPFQIVERVDLPGFGEVYAAYDHDNRRDVVIHVLRTYVAPDEGVRDWFEEEVRAAAARLRPDPLTIYLVGVDRQAVYIVSEALHAAPLTPMLTQSVAGAVRSDVRAPRRGWVAAAVVSVAVVAVAIFAIGGAEEPLEEAPPQAAADVEVPVVPPPPPIPEGELLPPAPEPREPAAPPPERAVPPALVPAPVAAPSRAAAAPSFTPSPVPPAAAAPRPPVAATDTRDTTTLITEATVHATEFDLDGALSLLEVAAGRGDAFARTAVLYLRGLISARDAFREGGEPRALAPVQESLTALGEISKGRPGAAEIARLVLQAAAAAAQSERDEMRLYIDSAIQMESLQLAAKQGGAPIVSASELAGDFWLQVSRYDEARRAYTEAAERVGFTLRILSGQARTARRLNDMPAACVAYRRLADAWGVRPGLPVEIAEARAYLGGCPR